MVTFYCTHYGFTSNLSQHELAVTTSVQWDWSRLLYYRDV